MLAVCQLLLRLCFLHLLAQVSLCCPEKQANHPAVNKAMVARHQATARGSPGRTPGLAPVLNEQCWLPQLITGKKDMFRSYRQGVLSCFLYSVSSVLRWTGLLSGNAVVWPLPLVLQWTNHSTVVFCQDWGHSDIWKQLAIRTPGSEASVLHLPLLVCKAIFSLRLSQNVRTSSVHSEEQWFWSSSAANEQGWPTLCLWISAWKHRSTRSYLVFQWRLSKRLLVFSLPLAAFKRFVIKKIKKLK